jgi:hypothetical protein
MTAMKTTSHFVLLAGSLALLPVAARAHAISTEDLRQVTARLQDGDLIFIRQANPIFRRVAETTRSWETHVGILFSDPNGTWRVAESRFPLSKFTRLERFIARAEHGRVYITRLQAGLSLAEKQRLRRAARARMRRWYDLGFNYDSPRLYCSKLVFDVYREVTGVPVGSLTTFRQLLADNPQAPMGFWRMWFFGRIPWERRCVTTTSEMKSPEFCPVYDSMKDK